MLRSMGLQWGDVPSEISAMATVFALGFASVAAVAARRTYRIESERDRVNSAARQAQEGFVRRTQAARVSAWWEKSADDGSWGAFVRNASEAPIYQVYLTILSPDDHTDAVKLHFSSIPPSEQARFLPVELPSGEHESRPADRRVKLTFTDSVGVRWTRNQYGRLSEMEPSLRIRADGQRAAVFAQFREDFLATYGVSVAFETDFDGYPQRQFIAAVQGESPCVDALVSPHDWIGDLVRHDMIAPTLLSADQAQMFPTWARKALTFDGLLYGLPVTADAVALIRNTNLAPQIPATFEDLISSGQTLRDAERVAEVLALRVGDQGDPFQVWPLFASAGGWLFGRAPDGNWDTSCIGIDSPESIAAFERLRSLGEAGIGVLRRSIDRTAAFDLFTSGRTAYLITTSDGLWHARRAGLPIAVSAVPPFADGGPATGFSLVHGLLMVKQGANSAIAQDLFADYLTHDHVVTALSVSIDSAVALRSVVAQDPAIRLYQQQCENGQLMPAFPQMEQIWRALSAAEVAVVSGADAEVTARQAAERLRAIFAG